MDLKTYIQLDAIDLAELIRKREVTPIEILKLSFAQLDRVNPTLNAVTHDRRERVMEEARKVNTDQPFSGVPILLKNISQAFKGEPITSGSSLFQTLISKQDSNFVTRLKEVGFLCMGHTNTPEFGLKNITEPKIYGPSRNPWNHNHSPGGSSGGAAAAVASGIVPIAGASDGGGSIRIPASFTGLVGLKPTRGRTPVGPGVGRQWQGASIDFVLSRSVRDTAMMLDILQVVQQEAAFQTALLSESAFGSLSKLKKKPLKIAFSMESPVGTPVSDDAKMAVKKMTNWLETEGHFVEEKACLVNGLDLMKNYYLMNSGEIASLMERMTQSLGKAISMEDVEIETWLLYVAGKSLSAAQYSQSLLAWDLAAAQMAKFYSSYDLFLTPTTATTAPKVGELTHSDRVRQDLYKQMEKARNWTEQQEIIWEMFLPSLTYTPFTQLANLTGMPAISIPVHTSNAGLPLGVQFMAPKGEENILLQLAAQIEQTEMWNGVNKNPYYS